MMHLTETQLNDYVDGMLDPAAADGARAHLLECAVCARTAEQLAALKLATMRLPREIAPDRDLRPGIWRRIDEPAAIDIARAQRRTLWSMRYRLATAAVILVLASSSVTLLVVREARRSGSPMNRPGDDIRLIGLDSRTLERRYSDEVRELEVTLQKTRGALAPETVRILEDNLTIIDGAIREAKTALAADPNSGVLLELLRSAYERKLELLRQAARSSPIT